MSEPHLVSAAAALERILIDMHPEYDWIVSVGEAGDDGQRAPTTPVGAEQAGAMLDDTGTVGDRDGVPAARLAHHDGFEEAA